jgi:hypothetical protein
MRFVGFDEDALALLDELPNMDADEYARHKRRLADGLTAPGRALITDVTDLLDAELTVVPRSSVSPLHTDLRFAPEGAPRYKDHLLLTTWEGGDKSTSPTLWIRVDAHRVGFASGIGLTPPVRDRWRQTVGGQPGESLAATLQDLVGARSAEIAGDELKKVPSPYDAGHPRADLLRKTGFQVRFVEPHPESVGSAEFVTWCVGQLGVLLPVHRWLVANLMGG